MTAYWPITRGPMYFHTSIFISRRDMTGPITVLLHDQKAKAVCQTYWTYKSMSSFLKETMPSLDVTGIMMDREMIAGVSFRQYT